MDPATETRASLLPSLEARAEELRIGKPSIKVHVVDVSLELGRRRLLSLSCLLQNRLPEEADLVELVVELNLLKTAPTIQAEVVWGHPSGRIEIGAFSDPVGFSKLALEKTRLALPKLLDALEQAIERGAPSETRDLAPIWQ
jgi:hypothetical protein